MGRKEDIVMGRWGGWDTVMRQCPLLPIIISLPHPLHCVPCQFFNPLPDIVVRLSKCGALFCLPAPFTTLCCCTITHIQEVVYWSTPLSQLYPMHHNKCSKYISCFSLGSCLYAIHTVPFILVYINLVHL